MSINRKKKIPGWAGHLKVRFKQTHILQKFYLIFMPDLHGLIWSKTHLLPDSWQVDAVSAFSHGALVIWIALPANSTGFIPHTKEDQGEHWLQTLQTV